MSRPVQVRKGAAPNRTLETRDQGVEATMSQRLRFEPTRGKGIGQFLENLSEYAGKRAAVDAKEHGEAMKRQAQADSAAGEFSEEFADQRAYTENINSLNGAKDALSLRLNARENLPAAMAQARADGEEFDPDEYFKQITGEFTQGNQYQDSFYGAGASGQLNELRSDIQNATASSNAKYQLEEASNTISGLAFTLARGGIFDAKYLKGIALNDASLSPNEADEAIATGVLSYLSQADKLEDLAVYDSYMAGLSDKQKAIYGPKLEATYRAAETRVDTNAKEKTLEERSRKATIMNSLMSQADKGHLNGGNLLSLELDGEITPDERLQLLQDNQRGLEKRNKDATSALDEQQQIQVWEKVVAHPEVAAQMSSKERTKFIDWYEESHQDTALALTSIGTQINDAVASGDQEKVLELRDQLSEHMESLSNDFEVARELGFTPRFIKNTLNNAIDPNSPNFAAAYEVYRAYRNVRGPDALGEINEGVVSRFDAFGDLKAVGYTNEQAGEVLSGRSEITPAQSRKALIRDTEAKSHRESTLEDLTDREGLLTGEIRNPLAIEESLNSLAAIHYRDTGNAEASYKWAADQIKKTHQEIDGYLVPSPRIRQGFGKLWKDNKSTVEDNLRSAGLLEEGQNIMAIPTADTDRSGRLALVIAGEDGEWASMLNPIMNAEGKPIEMNTDEMLRTFGKLEEQRKKDAGAAAFNRAAAIDDAMSDYSRNATLDPNRGNLPQDAARGAREAVDTVTELSEPRRTRRLPRNVEKRVLKPNEGASEEQAKLERATRNELVSHEGYREEVYEDHLGNATVGIGHKVTPEDNLKVGERISPERVAELFDADIKAATTGARALPVGNFDELPKKVQRALVNMVFQMGTAGVKKFTRTLSFIKEGDFDAAADEANDSLWAKQTPNRAKEVTGMLRSAT